MHTLWVPAEGGRAAKDGHGHDLRRVVERHYLLALRFCVCEDLKVQYSTFFY